MVNIQFGVKKLLRVDHGFQKNMDYFCLRL